MAKAKLLSETLFDNMDCGIYVLDDKGNFIFVNRAFMQMHRKTRKWFEEYNVYRLLREGFIDKCISDQVYQTKKRSTSCRNVQITK